MLNIYIYHWLPLADNMLLDIEKTLETSYRRELEKLVSTPDAIEYDLFAQLDNFGSHMVRGKVNQRGFLQHVIEVQPLPGVGINITIDEIVEKFRDYIKNFVFNIVPLSVKNKLAVLGEGIYSFQEFESEDFSPQIDVPAKSFLEEHQFTAILMDGEYKDYFRVGFYAERIGVKVDPAINKVKVYTTDVENLLLFYAENFMLEEKSIYDSVIYKYCALVIFAQFESHVIAILKQARDNIIPLRRALVIRLQKNTEEHFGWLTRLKKYLTYASVKLPVIEKVLNHQTDAYDSAQFKAKVETFDTRDKIEKFPIINSIEASFINQEKRSKFSPSKIINKIQEDYERLKDLFKEDTNEIKVLSQELSGVLQGNLMSENVQILSRELDASRLQVELDRGGKNRSNALKMLTYVTSATLGISIGNLFELDSIISALLGLGFSVGSFFLSELLIKQKSSYFRMVIPFNVTISRMNLENLLKTKTSKVIESNGTRRITTWSEKFKIKNFARETFDITMDYETRGYIHTITLENETNNINFEPLDLIIELIAQMIEHGCVMIFKDKSEKLADETSLLAEVLLRMDLYLVRNLKSLNKILALPVSQLMHDYEVYSDTEEGKKSLSEDQKEYIQDLIVQKEKYKEWLLSIQNNGDHRLYKLLGKDNLERKEQFLEYISAGDERPYLTPNFDAMP